MEWIDTHSHLYSTEFEGHVSELVERARAASVSRIITLGVTGETNRLSLIHAETYDCVYAAVGWQPQDLDTLGDAMELSPAQVEELRTQAQHPKTVAIGEIGLDYFRLPRVETDEVRKIKERQRRVFLQHLELAAELGLPCCIHQRGEGTFQDCVELMKPYVGRIKAVFHCFVGSVAEAQTYFDMGCLVSLTGIVTFKKAEELRETVRCLPADKLMVETDCPFLAPEPHFRQLCEPAYVVHTGNRVAGILGLKPEEFADLTTQTARKFFHKLK
ncbi:MAG: TatD family hydrolase [Verrucomicrobia bacterium]|nr:TatD family hydrolase [Verrucomicrobiota bacterium]